MKLNAALFAPGDRVLVGVSGGADSLALLHALTQLGIDVIAIHVHHGMRGTQADTDVQFLQAVCAEWHVPLAVEHADVPALATERGISVEEAGRDARYAAFGKIAAEHNCNKIATAHHADDQVETVLLNLFRGAGIDGLAGIPEQRRLVRGTGSPVVIRPLLRTTRPDIEAYCREHGLQPRHDTTNDDLAYKRNRIRAELLPVLESYDPDLHLHLTRLADQAREERELLNAEAHALLDAALTRSPSGFEIGLEELRAAPSALVRRWLREILDLSDRGAIERLVQLAIGERPGPVDLPGRLRARIHGRRLTIERTDQALSPQNWGAGGAIAPVALPGVTDAPEFGLQVHLSETEPPADCRLPPDEAVFDLAAVRPPLQLRPPDTGDRFQPLGAPGSKLLSDLFIDRKIQKQQRSSWPVLVDAAGILWVIGLAVAERARVHPDTTRCIRARALRPETRADVV